MCFGSCSKLKISTFLGICSYGMHIFYFIFVQFMQFPVLHFGLAHSGSRPFNWLLAFPQSGLSDAGKVTLKFVSQSSSRIQDSQVSTPLAQFEDPTPSPALDPRRPSRLVAQGGRDEPDTGEVPKRARRASEPPVKGIVHVLSSNCAVFWILSISAGQ